MKARITRSVLTLASVFLLAFVGTPAIASAQTWQLEQFERPTRMCVQQHSGNNGSYFLFIITGAWSTNLDVTMRGLPPGWKSTDHYLPPGENHRRDDGSVRVNGFMSAQGPNDIELGTYYSYVQITDGVVYEKFPVDIIITTDYHACRYG